MASVTLTALRSRVREAADMVNSSFVTDAATSLDAFINSGLDELYDLVVKSFENDYSTSASFNLVAGDTSTALPADFYRLQLVELVFNGQYVTLERYELPERNAFRNASPSSPSVPRYRREGAVLRFLPAVASALSGTIRYIPERTQLVAGSDVCSFPNGWEEYAVIHAAIRCLEKEESDASALMAEKASIRARILEAAEGRDEAEPPKTVDTDIPFRGANSRGWE